MDYTQINNYLSNKASNEEVEELFKWIDQSQENKRIFLKYKKAWALTANGNENIDQNWKLIQNKIKKNNQRKLFSNVLKYAAIFIVLIGMGYFFQKENNTVPKLKIDDTVVTIELENGKIEILSPNGTKKILDKNGILVCVQKGTELNYKGKSENVASSNNNNLVNETLTYNELNVPFGKTFQLVLFDGTQVTLNAGSSLKYPVKFLKGKNRQVFLNGEANFNVSNDANHPFVVNVNNMNVRALGTHFNISSYPEDEYYTTVLMEGSVGIYKNDDVFNLETSTILEPGFRTRWNKNSEEIIIDKVNTDIYTGWVSGKLIFKKSPFKNIRKKLERHYNVSIVNNNMALDEKIYNATFDIESIEEVLETLNTNYSIEYTIYNNQIIIN